MSIRPQLERCAVTPRLARRLAALFRPALRAHPTFMPSEKVNSLALLTGPEIRQIVEFDERLGNGVRLELDQIALEQGSTALRGLRLGIILWAAKAKLGHGHFMPWCKKFFGRNQKTVNRYMKVAQLFAKQRRPEPKYLGVVAQTAVSGQLVSKDSPLAQAAAWIGDRTLTELIAEAENTFVGKSKGAGTSKQVEPAGEQLAAEAAEHLRLAKVTLLDDGALIQMDRKQRTFFRDELRGFSDSYAAKHDQSFGKK